MPNGIGKHCQQNSEEEAISVKLIWRDFRSKGRIWVWLYGMDRFGMEVPTNILWLGRWFQDRE